MNGIELRPFVYADGTESNWYDKCPHADHNSPDKVHAWTWLRDSGPEQVCDNCGKARTVQGR